MSTKPEQPQVAGGGVHREAMGWGMGERTLPDGPLDISYQLKRDTYLGQDKPVLTLQDYRPG